MAPRVVNKAEKRREIASSCEDLIHELGISKITVSQVAKTAGIGKGTVYEYFENKNDIIFEIINIHIEKYHNDFLESIKDVESTKEKVFHFFSFVLDGSKDNLKHFNGYKDFLSIVLADENSQMKDFNCDTNDFFKNKIKLFINEGIEKGELIKEAANLAEGLLIFEKGLVLLKMTQNNYDVKNDFDLFINTIFDLIEVKK